MDVVQDGGVRRCGGAAYILFMRQIVTIYDARMAMTDRIGCGCVVICDGPVMSDDVALVTLPSSSPAAPRWRSDFDLEGRRSD